MSDYTREIDYDDDTEICEFPDCTEKAHALVFSRNQEAVLKCCVKHCENVLEERFPEYVHECENCDCLLPIN